MENNNRQTLRFHNHSIWPINIILVCKGLPDEHKTIASQQEMNQLLEEVKLYNSENENKKRIISL